MAIYDYLMQLTSGTVAGTANATGPWLDLMKGTYAAAVGQAGVDLYGSQNVNDLPLYAQIVCPSAATSPSTTFTLQEADDTGGTNLRTANGSSALVVTGAGEYKIPFNPTKRFVRLNSAWTAGTLPYTAAVSL